MPTISAQTCITNTGTTTLGGIFTIYTASTGPFSVFQTGVPLSSLTPPNCPYIMEVDSTTSQIRFVDNSTGCYIDMNIESSDLCQTCDINFNLLEQTQIGVLSAGILTGNCVGSITDYFIDWYGPNSTTNLAFTSGLGSAFPGYTWTHPLTGTSSVPYYAGVYTPVIRDIRINGLDYSLTGGSENIEACLDCFGTIELSANTCDSGNFPTSAYTHVFNFVGDSSSGLIPQPVYGTFNLSSNTKYFAYTFQGLTVQDNLKIFYSGANYSDLILLENITVGSNLIGSDTTYTAFPKLADTSAFISKVLSLTGLSQSLGDVILFKVEPFSGNPQTSWTLKYKCLEDFDCSNCLFDDIPVVKLQCKTISFQTGDCLTLSVDIKTTGCSQNQLNSSDIFKYFTIYAGGALGFVSIDTYFNTPKTLFFPGGNLLSFGKIACRVAISQPIAICDTAGTGNIYFSKYIDSGIGKIKITGDTLSDFNTYLNSWNNAIFKINNIGLINPVYDPDPENIGYYKYIILRQPTYPNPNLICGDGSSLLQYRIHPSCSFVTASTISSWSIDITMPTITNEGNWDCCKYKFTADTSNSSAELKFYNCDGSGPVTTTFTSFPVSVDFQSDETYGPISATTVGGGGGVILVECCLEVGCSASTDSVVNEINSSSTGTSNNYTAFSNTSSRYTDPFGGIQFTQYYNDFVTGKTAQGYFVLNDYLSKTIPASGNSNTLLYDLSAQTCDLSSEMFYTNSSPATPYWFRPLFYYRWEMLSSADTSAFIIKAVPLDINGFPIGWTPTSVFNDAPNSAFTETVYVYSGGAVQFSSCTYCYDC